MAAKNKWGVPKEGSLTQIFPLKGFESLPHSRANRESTAFFPKELISLPAKQEGKGKTPWAKH